MPHIAITGQDMPVRVPFQRVQYPFVNPDYSFVGLTGDAEINMAPL